MTSSRNLNSRRSSIQIITEILEASSGADTSKQDIISSVKVNYSQVKQYLDWLESRRLIKNVDRGDCYTRYHTTSLGLEFLDVIDNIKHLLNSKKSGRELHIF